MDKETEALRTLAFHLALECIKWGESEMSIPAKHTADALINGLEDEYTDLYVTKMEKAQAERVVREWIEKWSARHR